MTRKDFPILRTDRLLLRRFTEADLPQLYVGLSHPDIIKYYGVSYDSLEATRAQLQFFAELENEGTGIWWAICSPDDTVFYGAGGLNNLSHTHRKAEIGFWLMTEYWGRGIMTEALPLICAYGFDQFDLHRIEGFVESDNQPCKQAMRKLDFSWEGTLRECEWKADRFISLDVYAKIKTDGAQ